MPEQRSGVEPVKQKNKGKVGDVGNLLLALKIVLKELFKSFGFSCGLILSVLSTT